MKILITTGLSGADIGGPARYASGLKREFEALGHIVKISRYGSIEMALLRIWPAVFLADKILTLDTFSTGVPSVLAAKLFGKKVIARVGGDFLWSAYVNRTAEPIALPVFYEKLPRLNRKEKLIFSFMSWMIRRADFLAFNTEWQRNIWKKFYKISDSKSGVVRNFIPEKREGESSKAKNFLWAGRLIPEKNIPMLKKLNIEIATGESHEKIIERIRLSYAAVTLAFTDICPNFIIEAASFGKPFIATEETGLREIFPTGGIYVNSLDESEINAAKQALLDQSAYNRMVLELGSLYPKHSWRDLAEEYLEIWEKI